MSINTKLLEEELTEFCGSDYLSESGVRRIIHGVAPNNINNPNNDYKFFRAVCRNEKVTEGILRCLLEYFPKAVRHTDIAGQLPLHIALGNKNVTLSIVQLLIDAFPDSLSHENNKGSTPLHFLCRNKDLLDDEGGLKILELIIKRCPESVRHATENGHLPIHLAAAWQPPEFCRMLIEAYPGSERISVGNGDLPFHAACGLNTIATTKYLYKLYPESINVANNHGQYPIHYAIMGIKHREDRPETAIEMVQFLLDCDPNVVSQKQSGKLTLYWVCMEVSANDNTPKLTAYLKIVQILYDAYPEAIDEVTSNITRFHRRVQTFLNTQLTYARQARDRTLMNTRDENGQLPLHKALRGNVTLGSIKLLFKGNPSAIICADNKGRVPLHVACQYHELASVIEYLISLDPTSLHARDFDDNTALHHACCGANHAIIALLTETYGAVSVSKRNAHGQLPIDLLFASRQVSDRESVEYTESIFRLLRAYPMTLMHYDLRQADSEDCISHYKKKRKVDEL